MDEYQITMINLTPVQLENIVQSAVKAALKENREATALQTNENFWLSRHEAAVHLKISLPTLDSLTKKGIIVAYRTGRKKSYKLRELNESISLLKIKYK